MRHVLALAAILLVTCPALADGMRPVTFRYANVNRQALIGLPDGARKTLVLPDASLRSGDEAISFALADGRALGRDVPLTQSLVGGYLPMVRSKAALRGAHLSLTAFVAELPRVGPCDVVEIAADSPGASGALPLGLAASISGPSALEVRGGLPSSDGKLVLAAIPGEGSARASVSAVQRSCGHVGQSGAAGHYWPGPGPGFDPGFDNLCIGWAGAPLRYRFKVAAGTQYTVALGFFENYWHDKGHRLIEVEIDGRKVGVFDTVNGPARNAPFVAQYPARDENGDGVLDVVVRAAPEAGDQNSILNVLWVFDGATPRPADAVLSGALSRDAVYRVDCGGPDDRPFVDLCVRMSFHLDTRGRSSIFLVRPWSFPVERRGDLPSRLGPALQDAVARRWDHWLAGAAAFTVPHRVASDFYKASLINIMLMRDRTKDGLAIPQPGATVYRGFWIRDGAYIINALTSAGLFHEARESLAYLLTQQDPDGAWDRPPTQWDSLGQAPWAITTYCCLAGDADFLSSVYPRLVAGARWTARARAKTKVLDPAGKRPLTYGLLPPGFGDGGLPTAHVLGQDFWALYGLDLTIAAARRLGQSSDVALMSAVRDDFADCLRDCIARGFVTLPGGRGYVPPIPGDAEHWSQWGNLAALYPSRAFLSDPHMLATFRYLESREREGLPTHMGYIANGVWPYICCDVAKCFLLLGEYDKAAAMLYAILDHAAPTRGWIEEIDLASHAGSGDMPHGWAAANYILLLRDCLAFEDGDGLRLGAGVPRDWLLDGQSLGVRDLPTTFGRVTYALTSHVARGEMTADVRVPAGTQVVLHLRHPRHRPLRSVLLAGRPTTFTPDAVTFTASSSPTHVLATFAP
jgi:hypothetical protein